MFLCCLPACESSMACHWCLTWTGKPLRSQNRIKQKASYSSWGKNPIHEMYIANADHNPGKPAAAEDGGGHHALHGVPMHCSASTRDSCMAHTAHLGAITEKQALLPHHHLAAGGGRSLVPWILTFLGKLTLLTWLIPHPLPAQIYLCFVSGGKTHTTRNISKS